MLDQDTIKLIKSTTELLYHQRGIWNIEPGENITFDYSISEEIINSPFSCLCGSKNCRGYIK